MIIHPWPGARVRSQPAYASPAICCSCFFSTWDLKGSEDSRRWIENIQETKIGKGRGSWETTAGTVQAEQRACCFSCSPLAGSLPVERCHPLTLIWWWRRAEESCNPSPGLSHASEAAYALCISTVEPSLCDWHLGFIHHSVGQIHGGQTALCHHLHCE